MQCTLCSRSCCVKSQPLSCVIPPYGSTHTYPGSIKPAASGGGTCSKAVRTAANGAVRSANIQKLLRKSAGFAAGGNDSRV